MDESPRSPGPIRRFLIIYSLPGFWSMGEGMGAGSFWRTPTGLAARGHEVHISLPAEPGAPRRDEMMHGVHLHRYPCDLDFVPRFHSNLPVRLVKRVAIWLAYQRLGLREGLAVARELRPDLVIAHGEFEAPVARKVARSLGVPNVTRLFGNGLSVTLKDPIRFNLNFPQVIGFRTPCARLILTNDGADGEAVARRCGVPMERFVHLRNGLDFENFHPGPPDPGIWQRIGAPAGSPLVMTVTRLAMEKRLERVIDVMPSILERIPNAIAVLLGDGPEREALEARARARGVMDAVRMPGPVANRDLPAWYRAAAVVLSVLDRTNASNPVFEAMACERCVVALDTGTTREVIVNDRTGVLLDPKDLGKLGQVVVDLIEDPERRARLGAEARRHVRGLLLDPPARMDQEVAILLEVIDEARGG
jgi:glycosyltransferase involved in cell wall biosynthesis